MRRDDVQQIALHVRAVRDIIEAGLGATLSVRGVSRTCGITLEDAERVLRIAGWRGVPQTVDLVVTSERDRRVSGSTGEVE